MTTRPLAAVPAPGSASRFAPTQGQGAGEPPSVAEATALLVRAVSRAAGRAWRALRARWAAAADAREFARLDPRTARDLGIEPDAVRRIAGGREPW